MFSPLSIYVTSFYSIQYCSNSEYCSQKCCWNDSIHSTVLDVHALISGATKFLSSRLNIPLDGSTTLVQHTIFQIEEPDPYLLTNGGQT